MYGGGGLCDDGKTKRASQIGWRVSSFHMGLRGLER
jgi:hypothetical protein